MHELKNVGKSYGEKVVFDKFCATFKELGVTAIMGASGAGKTTLLNIVAGLTPFEGEKIGFGKGLSYVFQTPRLIPHLTVLKNVEYVLCGAYPDKNERKKVAEEYIGMAEIANLSSCYPPSLSGGEGQRVQLARAFAYPSDLLVMDEPFSSLDVALKTRLMNLFKVFLKKSPKTVLFVTHDPFEALTLADEVMILKNGSYKLVDVGKARTAGEDAVNKARDEIYAELQ